MNSPNHTSYRKLRLRILKVTSSVSFNFLHLRFSSRIALIGQIFVLGGIFYPWFAIDGVGDFSVFSKFLGGMWFLLTLSIVGSLILLLSNTTKEVLKNRFGVQIFDGVVMIFFWLFQLGSLIMGVWFIRSLSYFTKDIIFFEAPIFAIVGSILLVAGWVLVYKEQKKEAINSLYIENNPTTDAQFEEYRSILEKGNDKKNMTLPI